jgi:Zn-finger nucleic acid-binding protein
MDASTLNCPMCGAAARSDATRCEHCQARLATVACPACFGLLFLGAKFCPHCGEKAARTGEAGTAPRPCPNCRSDLQVVALGASKIHECGQCSGLWVDVETFQQICADREQQAAVLGGATPDPLASVHATLEEIRYRPCPVCATLMNRVNFSDRSGIIVDVCRGHGTWFDRDELRRIVEFIRAGGLEATRARDLQRWETEKRRRSAPLPASVEPAPGGSETLRDGTDLADLIYYIGRALFDFLKR